jgi:hypothetical protein
VETDEIGGGGDGTGSVGGINVVDEEGGNGDGNRGVY